MHSWRRVRTERQRFLILFATTAEIRVRIQSASSATQLILSEVNRAPAGGNTALFDAIKYGLDELDRAAGSGQLKALIVLTDGQENSSSAAVSDIQPRLSTGDCIFFGVAYGSDADQNTLVALGQHSGGHFTVTDEGNIKSVFELLSKHL